MVSPGQRQWVAAAAYLCLLNSSLSIAFSSETSRLQTPRSSVALFSSREPYNFVNEQGNGMSDGQRKQFRMVKQFNGDFKTVPYNEVEGPRNNEGFSEMGSITSRRRGENPNFTSPARAVLSKQWDWKPPAPGGRPRFRQVRTFSGDMKTVPYEEAEYQGPRNAEYGRVDGTNYIPEMGPRIVYRYEPRIPPPPPPPGPPPLPRNSLRPPYKRSDDRRRGQFDMAGFKPKLFNDMGREMQKYRQDFYFMDDADDYYDQPERKEANPLKRLAKETEKVLRRITGSGGGHRMAPPRTREHRDAEFRSYPAAEHEFRNMAADEDYRSISGSFNSSPAIRSFEAQKPHPPPGYYPEEPITSNRPSFAASPAAQSFSRRRPSRLQQYRDQQPRYRMERQFNGDYRSVRGYDDDDGAYGNPAANSEVGRIR